MSGYGPPRRRRRRRRRRHTSAVVRTPEQLQQRIRRPRVSTTQALACTAVAVICLALIVLIWLNTNRAINEMAEDQRGRVEAAVTAQATTLAEQARHELIMIDQSLAVLQAGWDADPMGFKLDDWMKRMLALTTVADDIFIANAQHIIQQDIVPAAVGQGIGSAYTGFANGSLEPIKLAGQDKRDNAMVVGELGSGGVAREYLMYLVRPLAQPAGWLIGASYRSQALTEVFARAGLGEGGFAALIDTHRGGVQALAGSAAVRPLLSINNTPMYQAMLSRPDGGIWIGQTPIDNVDRIVAFRRVPDRDLIVAVGMTTSAAMAPAAAWASAARTLATVASLLVLAIIGSVMWEVYHWRRIRHRQRALAETRALLAGVQVELTGLRTRAAVSDAQLHATLGTASDSIALVDAAHRLVNWTSRFAELSHLPPEELHEGLPLEELLRQQALMGLTQAQEDVEAEVARRMASLCPDGRPGECDVTFPNGAGLELRSHPTPGGGLVLVLTAVAAPVAATEETEEQAPADPVEW